MQSWFASKSSDSNCHFFLNSLQILTALLYNDGNPYDLIDENPVTDISFVSNSGVQVEWYMWLEPGSALDEDTKDQMEAAIEGGTGDYQFEENSVIIGGKWL